MLVFRLLVTLAVGFFPSLPGRTEKYSMWHFTTFLSCAFGIGANVVSCILLLLSIISGPISYLYYVGLAEIAIIRVPILLAIAQLIEQMVVFIFECLSRLSKINRRIVDLPPAKQRLKNYLVDFCKGLAYDFTFYSVLSIAFVVFGGGILYMLLLVLLMIVKAKVVTPLWRFI